LVNSELKNDLRLVDCQETNLLKADFLVISSLTDINQLSLILTIHQENIKYVLIEIIENKGEISNYESLFNQLKFDRISKLDSASSADYLLFRSYAVKMVSSEDITLSQPWGGLGDNLAFSTLPEQFSSIGKRFFLHRDNAYRNTEIEEIVWSENPFVCGISVLEPNAGNLSEKIDLNFNLPFIGRIEENHGLAPVSRWPSLFLNFKIIEELQNSTVVDLSSVSVAGIDIDGVKNFMAMIFTRFKLEPNNMLQAKFTNHESKNPYIFSDLKFIEITSLRHYANVLYSCKNLVTIHSGAHSLAVAIRAFPGANIEKIYCIVPKSQFNVKNYIFDDVEYFVN